MSQRDVEKIIGRLVTDEEFRRLFRADREQTIQGEVERGTDLTQSEVAALLATDVSALDRVAESLDPRLQKASLRCGCPPASAERRKP